MEKTVKTQLDLNTLSQLILEIDWAKKVVAERNVFKQLAKTTEELGELAGSMLKENEQGIKDGIGDVFVTINLLAAQHGLTLTECVQYAYDQIKGRTGRMVEGTFVKDEGLRPIESLKPDEGILIENIRQRDEVLELMNSKGWLWGNKQSALSYRPTEYPFVLNFNFNNDNRISVSLLDEYKEIGAPIVSALDFIGSKNLTSLPELYPYHRIVVKNDFERDEVLKLMESKNWIWEGGLKATEYKPEAYYPYALMHMNFGHGFFITFSLFSEKQMKRGEFILASDILPIKDTEHKAAINASLGEIQETNPEIDWSKPQAFPNDYVIKEKCRVVIVSESCMTFKKGTIGTIIPDGTVKPIFFPYDPEIFVYKSDATYWYLPIDNLAPLDPTDHPLHPEFKQNKP